jgi:hypothetical protein
MTWQSRGNFEDATVHFFTVCRGEEWEFAGARRESQASWSNPGIRGSTVEFTSEA